MSYEDRRSHPRIRCRFYAELHILFPEETFRPHPYMAQVSDVSQAGMKVKVSNLPHEQYRLLISAIRFARVIVRGGDHMAKVYSRIVWISARKDKDEKVYHELGLCFEERDQGSAEDIDFILTKARSTEYDGPEDDSPICGEDDDQ